MKTKKIFLALSLIVSVGLLTQCEKYDYPEKAGVSDENSVDGGTKAAKDNKGGRKNDSGTPRGGDYGDLYELLRLENGVPVLWQIGDEFYVQPVGVDGLALDLDGEGELVDPLLAIGVEFGRLNIVRSPPSVLDNALKEALKVLAAPYAVISLDFCGRLTSTYPDPVSGATIVKTIDSPRENMAIYRTIMQNSKDSRLAFLGALDPLKVAASCFAAGSDKTGTVNIDEVVYINGFMACIGLYPDEDDAGKEYFDFGNLDGLGMDFSYNRSVYADRYLKIITLNGDGTYTPTIESVLDAMESRGLFTEEWPNVLYLTQVEGFTWAVDDAVQVLDYVHGDSNIEFLPDYTP